MSTRETPAKRAGVRNIKESLWGARELARRTQPCVSYVGTDTRCHANERRERNRDSRAR